jgi:hypothetical protein
MPSEIVTDHAPTYLVILEELLPVAWHHTDQYANNGDDRQMQQCPFWHPLVLSRPSRRSWLTSILTDLH